MAMTPLDAVVRGRRRSPSAMASGSVLLGALCLSVSAILIKLAGVDAPTAAFLRCAIALVLLVPLAGSEARRLRPLSRRGLCWSLVAGCALGIDYSSWTASIYDVGAGISTVLLNVQVIVLPLLALALDREPVARRFWEATPVMLLGIALVGGVGGAASREAPAPVRGTLLAVLAGVGYGIYLYLTRRGARHDPRAVLQPLAWATASAAVTCAVLSVGSTGLRFDDIGTRGWVLLATLAVLGQVLAWLLIHHASPSLPPTATAALLLVQPVLALVLSAVLVSEHPRWPQLVGVVLVLAAVGHANRISLRALRWGGADRDRFRRG